MGMGVHGKPDIFGPYSTTYGREFLGKSGTSSLVERPRSTHALQTKCQLTRPMEKSTYGVDFGQKSSMRQDHQSSWTARNNPQPSDVFLRWHMSKKMYYEPLSSGPTLSDDLIDRICRGNLKSTYQADFKKGTEQYVSALPFESRPNLDPSSLDPSYSLTSQMRYSYQMPKQLPMLKGNTSRYGCNKFKMVPPNGVVPTVVNRPKIPASLRS